MLAQSCNFINHFVKSIISGTFASDSRHGEVSEWSIEHAWKACVLYGTEGSNPSLSSQKATLVIITKVALFLNILLEKHSFPSFQNSNNFKGSAKTLYDEIEQYREQASIALHLSILHDTRNLTFKQLKYPGITIFDIQAPSTINNKILKTTSTLLSLLD